MGMSAEWAPACQAWAVLTSAGVGGALGRPGGQGPAGWRRARGPPPGQSQHEEGLPYSSATMATAACIQAAGLHGPLCPHRQRPASGAFSSAPFTAWSLAPSLHSAAGAPGSRVLRPMAATPSWLGAPGCCPPPRPTHAQPCTRPVLPYACGLRAPPSPACPSCLHLGLVSNTPSSPWPCRLMPGDPSGPSPVGDPVVEGPLGVRGPLELAQRRQGWGSPHECLIFSHEACLAHCPARRRRQGDSQGVPLGTSCPRSSGPAFDLRAGALFPGRRT